jgi:subtilisin family serine protease
MTEKRAIVSLVLVVLVVAATTVGAGAEGFVPGGQSDRQTIAPEVRQALESLPAGQRLPVIVTFVEQADLRSIGGEGRAARLEQLVRMLQQTAETTQRPVRALLAERRAAHAVDQVTYFWVFNGLAMAATSEVISEFAARSDVQSITLDVTFAEPDPIRGLTESVLGESEPNLALMRAPALWDLGFQGHGVVVAGMDTGVSVSHPDLADRWRGGTNSWFDPYSEHPTTPVDLNGHGTATMGVMVGGDAGGTAIGVAPLAQWIAVKLFDDSGEATKSAVHQGFQWLLDPDGDPATPDAPHVVNNSWSIGNAECDLDFQLDLQALRAAGIVPVFAAGNGGPGTATSRSPANNPEALAVGATDNADQIYVESSRGPSDCGEPTSVFPEIVAPGVGIRTTGRYGTYDVATGTSVAAPHVAGALALLLSADPNLTVAQQEAALMHSAVDLGLVGPDNTFGAGRLDVLAAYRTLFPLRIYLPRLAGEAISEPAAGP